jgi:DNA-directed RNA polymerase subunit RPC12/RpoP
MQVAGRRAILARMDTTKKYPVLYCPRCRRSTEATADSELACPRCGQSRLLFKLGAQRKDLKDEVRQYVRPVLVDEALASARVRLGR